MKPSLEFLPTGILDLSFAAGKPEIIQVDGTLFVLNFEPDSRNRSVFYVGNYVEVFLNNIDNSTYLLVLQEIIGKLPRITLNYN